MTSISLIVHDAEEFKAAIPSTSLFEMYDCALRLEVPPHAPITEIEKITDALKFFINVTDVEVTLLSNDIHDYDPEEEGAYRVFITETPFAPRKRNRE